MSSSPLPTPSDVRWFAGSQFRTLAELPDYDVCESLQPPGACTPLHRHTAYAEHLFVLGGDVEVRLGDETLRAGPGTAVTIPVGVPHMVRSGPAGAHAIVSSRPGRFAGLMAQTATAQDTAPDLEAFAAASAAIGDEILGPPDVALDD